MSREYIFYGQGSALTKMRRFRQGGLQTWNGSTWIDTSTISDANFGSLGVVNLTQVVTADATALDYFSNDTTLGSAVEPGEFGFGYVGTPVPGAEATLAATPARGLVAALILESIAAAEIARMLDIMKTRDNSAVEASSYANTANVNSTYAHEQQAANAAPDSGAGVIHVYSTADVLLFDRDALFGSANPLTSIGTH